MDQMGEAERKIEVTAEMIEAGELALDRFKDFYLEDQLAIAVYTAMAAVAPDRKPA